MSGWSFAVPEFRSPSGVSLFWSFAVLQFAGISLSRNFAVRLEFRCCLEFRRQEFHGPVIWRSGVSLHVLSLCLTAVAVCDVMSVALCDVTSVALFDVTSVALFDVTSVIVCDVTSVSLFDGCRSL